MVGGTVMAYMGGLLYWWPKITVASKLLRILQLLEIAIRHIPTPSLIT